MTKDISKVTRKAYSHNITASKYSKLLVLAKKLGAIRDVVWHQYGALRATTGLNDREIRNIWVKEKRDFGVPARLRNETLRDSCDNINAYHEAAKKLMVRKIYKHTSDSLDRKRLCKLLASPKLTKNSYVHRLNREYFKHGKNHTHDQIVLDAQCYRIFVYKNKTWIKVIGDIPRQRIAIPLNGKPTISGTIRLILKDGAVEIHYTVEAENVCVTRKCGPKTIGVDKGYTETFTDSDGAIYGANLGETLSKQSDYLKAKYQRRYKLKAIAKNKPHKSGNIEQNNLGRKKLNDCKHKHTQGVKDIVYKSIHSVLDKADTVVTEDLTFTMKSKKVSNPKKYYGKNMNRKLSGWVKGVIASGIKDISKRRGATLHVVNAAYTSQICHQCGFLGERKGDMFYCTECKVVNEADHNAAINILNRLYDNEIKLCDTPAKVRKMIEYRNSQRSKLIDLDSSCPSDMVSSTESELVHEINLWNSVRF